ncbi:MAG: hypothetical protein JRH05_14595 [Deltaproteobacteria bacterium]|nr:hypothetical protein [Deltaproteobacteria bacterium]MBW1950951.1 hypothetical protein [Deltaproteobacteria bacterium]MBW2008730.1 hypothetical protein [Deltaproteobacteria bacterium]MBW2103857.1 hypothetical protein [Deltaproteobacteria bacterium]
MGYEKRKSILRGALILLGFLLVAAFVGPQGAEASSEWSERLSSDLKSVFSVIRWKGPGKILTRDMEFGVSPATRILDMKGKRISLRRLPVPCKAEVRYRLSSRTGPHMALEIRVHEIPRSAGLTKGGRLIHRSSTRWSEELPE